MVVVRAEEEEEEEVVVVVVERVRVEVGSSSISVEVSFCLPGGSVRPGLTASVVVVSASGPSTRSVCVRAASGSESPPMSERRGSRRSASAWRRCIWTEGAILYVSVGEEGKQSEVAGFGNEWRGGNPR